MKFPETLWEIYNKIRGGQHRASITKQHKQHSIGCIYEEKNEQQKSAKTHNPQKFPQGHSSWRSDPGNPGRNFGRLGLAIFFPETFPGDE